MNVRPSRTLQRIMYCLPKPLRRIKVCQWLGLTLFRTSRHQLNFGACSLVGDIRDGTVANSLIKKDFADYGFFRLARNLLQGGDVLVDVGANFGFHTFGLFAFPELRPLLFVMIEANPECLACLTLSRALHPDARTVLIPCAVGRVERRLNLTFRPGEMGSGHVVGRAGPGTPAPDAVEVEIPCRTLDQILPEAGATKIRLMKMDIEGSETDALGGARRYLAEGRIEYVYFEVNAQALAQRGSTTAELLDLVEDAGFRLFWPHDDMPWLGTVCGRDFDRREESFVRLPGRDRLLATKFSRERHPLNAASQLDLLAIHQSQPLETVFG